MYAVQQDRQSSDKQRRSAGGVFVEAFDYISKHKEDAERTGPLPLGGQVTRRTLLLMLIQGYADR